MRRIGVLMGGDENGPWRSLPSPRTKPARAFQSSILLFREPIVGVMQLKARAGKSSKDDPCRLRAVFQ
jgi:hypothetical protein